MASYDIQTLYDNLVNSTKSYNFKELCTIVGKLSQLMPELNINSGDLLTNYT